MRRRCRCRTLDGMTNTMTNPNTVGAAPPHPIAARRAGARSVGAAPPPIRNGVDTATLFATLDAVKGDNEIADFQFRATNRWVSGTHNQSTIDGFYGAKQEMTHDQPRVLHADHPAVLVGDDHGPTPVEYVLHALAACLTAGIANIAAARGNRPRRGVLHRRGRHRPARHPRPVRRGPQRVPADPGVVHRQGRATPTKLRQVVDQSRKRSAVYDILTNGVPVSIEVDAG